TPQIKLRHSLFQIQTLSSKLTQHQENRPERITMKPHLISCLLNLALLGVFALPVAAQTELPKMKMTTEIPSDITTPDKIDTRLGTLKFDGGYPDAETVQKVYDNLDFQRGVDVFLNSLQGASLVAMRRGLREI